MMTYLDYRLQMVTIPDYIHLLQLIDHHRLQTIDYRSQTVTVDYRPWLIDYRLQTTNHDHRLSTVAYRLQTVGPGHGLWPIGSGLQFATGTIDYRLQVADYSLQAMDYRVQIIDSRDDHHRLQTRLWTADGIVYSIWSWYIIYMLQRLQSAVQSPW